MILYRLLQSDYGGFDMDLDKPVHDYDFYRESSQLAEMIINEMVLSIQRVRPLIIPGLFLVSFHDGCFEGCDAATFLNKKASRKDAMPNEFHDIIDAVKFVIERICPRTVSCADFLVLTAHDSFTEVGGQTSRRDSMISYKKPANYHLHSPVSIASETLMSFASRGFDDPEPDSLLGSHSMGLIHCKFFKERFYNLSGTNGPDLSFDPEFLQYMRYICSETPITERVMLSQPSKGVDSTSKRVNETTAHTIVGVVGDVFSLGLYLSPIPTIRRIRNNRDVQNYKPDLYVAAVFSCAMWAVYGMPFVHPDSIPILVISVIGLLLELVYLSIFLKYCNAQTRRRITFVLVAGAVLTGAAITATLLVFHTTEKRTLVVGIMSVVFNAAMYIAPLTVMRQVIQTQSVIQIPILLSILSLANGLVWMVYTLLKYDINILVPVSGIASGLMQLCLYARYYHTTQWPENSDTPVDNVAE